MSPTSCSVLLAALAVLSYSGATVLAQEPEQQESPTLNTTDSGIPILEKVSEKGIYRVQLKWPQVQVNPDNAFDLEIVFLNASAPQVNNTAQQGETNFTGSGNEVGMTTPGSIESPLPVKSFDIAIYSDDGTVLWNKTKEPGEAGRAGQRIDFERNYTGPVTIEITNILPGWETGTSTAEDAEALIDSVKFAATIVPEFSVLAVPVLALGFSAGAILLRLRHPTRIVY